MPKIPTLDTFTVQDNTLPSARMSSALTPDQASYAGRQMEQAGQKLQQGASDFIDLQVKQLEEANQLRVDDAINRRNEAKLRLLYDKQAGLVNVRGVDALQRPSGKPLADEYGEEYRKSIDEIAGTLGNSVQREAFMKSSEEDFVSFYGTAMKHEGDQFREYTLSVRDGTIANRINEIGVSYNDPEAVDKAVTSIKAAAYDKARLLGKSAEEAEALARDATSKAHVTAIASAIEKGQVKYADGYMKKYAKDLNADDLLKAQGVLTKEMDAQIASETVREVMTTATPRLVTSEGDRAFNIAVGTESNYRQFGKDGKPLTSSAGAIGIAQVMPGTGPEAAKLAGLEWDEERYKNDANYNYALGKAYFGEQLKQFDGNLPMAYAAYNAGPGATRQAVEKAAKAGTPDAWLDYLPQETQNYVTKNMKQYSSGEGRFNPPTLQELQNQVRERIGDKNPERLDLALKEVERQFEVSTKAIKQRNEEAVGNAMQQLISNGGSYADLPPSIRSAIPAPEVPKVMEFASKIAKGQDAQTDWALYYKLKLNEPNLGDVNLLAFRDKLADTEFKQLVDLQNDVRTGKGDQLADIRGAKDVLNQFMREAGIDPSPKDDEADKAAVVGKVFNMFEKRVADRRRGLGRSLNATELREEAARMFATVDVPGMVYGTNQAPYAATVAKGGKIEIPANERQQIVQELKAAGLQPTDNVIELIYLRKKGVMR